MESPELEMMCPNCLSRETPILVVWGTGIVSGGLSLQCRLCQHKWSAEQMDHRQAS
jgi:hypothetical protein